MIASRLSDRRKLALSLSVALALPVALAEAPASALQPLDEFVLASRTRNPTNKEQLATVAQRVAEADQAWGRVLPDITARGVYTRNQYEVDLPPGTFGPAQTTSIALVRQDQLDAYLGLDVPILDLGNFSRIRATRATTEAAQARQVASSLDVDKSVVRTYLQLVASYALVSAAEHALEVEQDGLRVITQRHGAGTASDLELDRASAEVESRRRTLADAEATRDTNRRALQSLSGLPPTDGAPVLDDDLHEEPPEASLEPLASGQPAVRAAQLDVIAADRNADATKATLLPTLVASATEHITNAPGFAGQNESYQILGTLAWRLDYVGVAGIRGGNAALAAARAREEGAIVAARDEVNTSWLQVRSGIVKSRAARAQAAASAHAAVIARNRYLAGASTQLDVLQAGRDALQAEVSRIQADADLAYARAQLRIATGRAATSPAAPHP